MLSSGLLLFLRSLDDILVIMFIWDGFKPYWLAFGWIERYLVDPVMKL